MSKHNRSSKTVQTILFNLSNVKTYKKFVIAWYPVTYVIMMHFNIINFYFHFLIQKIRKIVEHHTFLIKFYEKKFATLIFYFFE